MTVVNTAAVPVSVSSHFHFFEANPRLRFDRAAAYGRRLAVPAGETVRFDPGVPVPVALVPLRGERVVDRLLRPGRRAAGCARRARDGPRAGARLRLPRGRRRRRGRRVTGRGRTSTAVFRPGDRVRLGDTGLVVRVEAGLCRSRHAGRRLRPARRVRQDRPRRDRAARGRPRGVLRRRRQQRAAPRPGARRPVGEHRHPGGPGQRHRAGRQPGHDRRRRRRGRRSRPSSSRVKA